MQKFVNDAKNMVDESIQGFFKCYCDRISPTACSRTLKYAKAPVPGKVGVVIGGGFGHAPAFMGYLGKGAVDAVAIGNIFEPPSVESFYTAFKESDSGNGVICLIGNYPKDIVNVKKAIESAEKEGIKIQLLIANDDVATSDKSERRGMTGEVLLWKIVGSAADQGYSLKQLAEVGQKTIERVRSIGVGLASCIIPEVGRPNYLIEMGTMEIGVGHHGLFSRDTCKLRTADETADIMLDDIISDMPLNPDDSVCVMVSGLGNTMMSELNILYSRVHDQLKKRGVHIHRSFTGDFFTSLDMMGATLTILKLDDELKKLLDIPAYSVSLNHFAFS